VKTTSAAQTYTAGRYYDLSMLAGNPRPNVYPGSMGAATPINCIDASNYKTSLFHARNVSPHTKHLFMQQAYSAVSTVVPSVLTLCDYLLFYPMIDLDDDSRQDLVNDNTLTRYTDGKGVRAFIVTTTDTGVNTAYLNYEYINQNDETKTHSQLVYLTPSSLTTQILHSGVTQYSIAPFLPLAPGDSGMKRVTAVQLSAGMGGGFGCLVLCKPLANIPIVAQNVPVERCYFAQQPSLPRIYDGAYLNYLMFAGGAVASSSSIFGSAKFIWGT
jgi:hypothetical protein